MEPLDQKNLDTNKSSLHLAPKVEVVHSAPKKKLRRIKTWHLVTLAVFAAVIITGIVFAKRVTTLSNKVFVGQKITIYSLAAALFHEHVDHAAASEQLSEPVNILLLGVGGAGHDGAYLSDTIIVMQIRPDNRKVSLVSIPRDYLINLKGYGKQKINAAFAYGYQQHSDYSEAGEWARTQVGQLTGLNIPYFAVLDFRGFKQVTDLLGGLDIQVDRTFTDYAYPADVGIGYLAPVTFKEGLEHMNGTRALEFVRSRHAAGPEGTDFARSLRQQKILQAAKEKIVQLNLISNVGTINSLLSVFADHFHTNATPDLAYLIYNTLKGYPPENIISSSLTPDTGLICPYNMPITGSEVAAYTLIPCAGVTAHDIQKFFADSFNPPTYKTEHSILWVADSIKNLQQYNTVVQQLTAAGFIVYRVAYKGPMLSQTQLYQINNKPLSASFLENLLGATATSSIPAGIKFDSTKADILVVIGGVSVQ